MPIKKIICNIIDSFFKYIFHRNETHHFSGIFSNESGESMEKHIKITWVSGYDSGRNRS